MNVYGDRWDVDRAPTGPRERLLHLGRGLGGELLGATVFEVDPGWKSLYHVHHGNEELLLVLAGRPTLRTPDGKRELEPGDTALFRRGPDGAHAISNESDGPVRFVVFSSMVDPDIVEQPDAGTLGVFVGGVPTAGRDAELELFFPREAAIGYFEIPR